MPFALKTAPVQEPVDIDYIRLYTRIDTTAEDDVINVLIKAAREYAEIETGRTFVSQTWLYKADGFDCDIALKPDLQSITHIKYLDAHGASQTVDPQIYAHDDSRVYLKIGGSWPSVARQKNAIEIEFISGVNDIDDVSTSIKHAIALLVSHWYENREAVIVGASAMTAPMGVKCLLNGSKIHNL